MGLLRLLLAVAVVLGHDDGGGNLFGYYMTGSGQLPVQSFYVISGFLISMVFTEKYAALPNGTRRFYVSRFLRLWPAFVVVGAITAIGLPLFASMGHPLPSHFLLTGFWTQYAPALPITTKLVLALPNATVLGTDWLAFFSLNAAGHFVFSPRDAAGVWASNFLLIPQGWTLGIELSFYVIAPLLLRQRTRVLIVVALASVALRLWTYYGLGLTTGVWTYRVFPQELALFLAGALMYRWYAASWSRVSVTVRRTLGLAAAIVLVGGMFFYDRGHGAWRFWAYLAMVPLGVPLLFDLTRRSSVDRFIGELSYPVYICHIGLFPYLYATGLSRENGFLVVGGTITAAIVLYLAVQRPVDRWRHRLTAASRASSSATLVGTEHPDEHFRPRR